MQIISFLAINLCALQFSLRGVWAEEPIFPTPNRPVAQIISAKYSDEKTRDLHHEAELVMDLLGVKPGVRVADIGAGRGYYTVRLSARVGPGAILYATDVNADHLKELQARLESNGIGGVKLVLGSPNDPTLPPAAIDIAILAHVYHESRIRTSLCIDFIVPSHSARVWALWIWIAPLSRMAPRPSSCAVSLGHWAIAKRYSGISNRQTDIS